MGNGQLIRKYNFENLLTEFKRKMCIQIHMLHNVSTP